jgi:S-adenosyl-L-methionine hydrolase (adenosine-forming)
VGVNIKAPVPVITLLTDFGLEDAYVGTMKGVLLSRAPSATLVDLTHAIPAGDVMAGALHLASAARYFPVESVHLAVVDPGVGGRRRAIAAKSAESLYVGPDNGLLSVALEEDADVRALENPHLRLPRVSRTFHGRDVFAPAAAWLAATGDFAAIGPRVTDWQRLTLPEPEVTRESVIGEVLLVDRFGNAVTNLRMEHLAGRSAEAIHFELPEGINARLVSHYGAVRAGTPLVIEGSMGYLEVAVNRGSAAQTFRLARGSRVAATFVGG